MSNQTIALHLDQPSFPDLCPVTSAVEALATLSGTEARGAVFTRREIVEFILDLVGYRAERPLWTLQLLEPSFGGGDFLLAAVERLLAAWQSSAKKKEGLAALGRCIRAVELHQETFHASRAKLMALLQERDVPSSTAGSLADQWLIHGDFLLIQLDTMFDVVVGNPPYVRQELIPDVLLREYRNRYTTVYDRADLYIPFIERSLLALAPRGRLAFICADRWMKNRYGGPLRKLIADHFQLQAYVDMVGTSAFHSEVSAYPAITVIGREKTAATRVAHRPSIDSNSLARLATELTAAEVTEVSGGVRELENVAQGSEPWILDCSDQMPLLRRIERDFPLIEEADCRIGIGVATGADDVFIGPYHELDVEPDRKLPLAMTKDIVTGEACWRGLGVINPFAAAGGLVDLADYPRLKRYLEQHKSAIAGRHCARKIPANWYRTIDRITPSLATTPKLLIPDIKGDAQVVYEEGLLYPHHNLYFVTSSSWDLRALQAVLMSGIARLFVATYSTKLRGGYLRFQAQYLRRIHVPRWSDVGDTLRHELITAAVARNAEGCDFAVAKLYGLTAVERDVLARRGRK